MPKHPLRGVECDILHIDSHGSGSLRESLNNLQNRAAMDIGKRQVGSKPLHMYNPNSLHVSAVTTSCMLL